MKERLEKLRGAGAFVATLAATGLLLRSVHKHYPLQDWLFFRYALYWAGAGCLSLAALALGHATLRTRLGRGLPPLERLAIGGALGVFELQLLLFVTGMLQWYGPVLFFALPLLALSLGGPGLFRELSRARRHLRARGAFKSPTPTGWLVIGLGCVALLALYLPVMVPANSSFDARWRHMVLAEQYVVHGGIRRFPEGWAFGASPQFTPLLYAWAFMAPHAGLFDHAELCAHIEYVIFLWTTLLCIPALVRRLAPQSNPALTWAARFLFPGVFLYDSNLSTGADHIGAVLAAPIFLVCLRMWRRPSVGYGLLLGALIAAAACAKETTALLLAPFPIALVATRFLFDVVGMARARAEGVRRVLGSLAAGGATLVLSAPHWLKNLIWYGDPLFPNLYKHFALHPWGPASERAFVYALGAMLWRPSHDEKGLREAVRALWTFSFEPHSWWSMHRDVPVYGSLFTLFILILPFLRKTARLWALALCVHFSIFIWFWVHHEDRHLQALAPLMAALVASGATLVMRQRGVLTRAALVLLLGAQVVWGADIYFYPTHSMVGTAPVKTAADFLAQGYLQNYVRRFDYQMDQQAIGRALPPGAVVLMHERRDPLGTGHSIVTDFYGDQYALDYALLASPERVYAQLRSLGVTHVAWRNLESEGYAPIGGDLAFFEFAEHFTQKRVNIGGYVLAQMPARAPARPEHQRVAVLGCKREYATGLYELRDLNVACFGPDRRYPRPRTALDASGRWLQDSAAIAIDTTCSHPDVQLQLTGFQLVARRGPRWCHSYQLWLRSP